MSKPKFQSRRAENEAKVVVRNLRTSARKLNLLCQQIRGMAAGAALAELSFSKRRIAKDVKKALQSAIANAENNHQLDVDRLVVAEASVGKSFIMKRFHARARGRSGKVVKPWSRVSITVRETAEKKA